MTEEEILHSHFGEWGSMRRDYLRRTQPEEWARMVREGIAEQYLRDYDDVVYDQFVQMTEEACRRDGVTEELKKRDVMKWIRAYNSVLAEVREILRYEVMPPIEEESM